MIYLASPYSHPNPEVRYVRFRQACRAAGDMMRNGLIVFSPIAHTHPIADLCDLPTGWDFWETYDREMLTACSEVIVLQLDGWADSKGVAAEIKIAQELGLPITYMKAL